MLADSHSFEMPDSMMPASVLFVDDEPNLTASVKRMLRSHPFEVYTAESAREGLSLLEETQIDIVVSDEHMPGMSGSKFLAEVRNLYPGTARIMLTGRASLEAAVSAINEGEVFRLITKPCDPPTLVAVLYQAAQQRCLMNLARRLLRKSQEQAALIQRLERENPGITKLETDEAGAILVDDFETTLVGILDAFER